MFYQEYQLLLKNSDRKTAFKDLKTNVQYFKKIFEMSKHLLATRMFKFSLYMKWRSLYKKTNRDEALKAISMEINYYHSHGYDNYYKEFVLPAL